MNSDPAFINASREWFLIIFESILLAGTLNFLVICLTRIVFKILVGECTTKSWHITSFQERYAAIKFKTFSKLYRTIIESQETRANHIYERFCLVYLTTSESFIDG